MWLLELVGFVLLITALIVAGPVLAHRLTRRRGKVARAVAPALGCLLGGSLALVVVVYAVCHGPPPVVWRATITRNVQRAHHILSALRRDQAPAMGNDRDSRYHRLIIRASPRTDVWLADDKGFLVQKERGTLDTSLLPGHYVVEFGLGEQTYPIDLVKDSEYSQAEIQALPSCPRPKVKLAPPFTAKQGQYLAFIYYFTKIHGKPPSEAELQRYFRVAPPSVHQMVRTLESKGLIVRAPGKARSIRLLVDRAELPDLD